MRNFLFFITILFSLSIQYSCGGEEGSAAASSTAQEAQISGVINGASNLQAFLDKQGAATRVIAKSEVDANGTFTMSIPKPITPGQYRFRIGAKRVGLIFDGSEENIKISGDLAKLDKYDFQISGSSASAELSSLMKNISSGSLKGEALINKVQSLNNPYAALAVATTAFKSASSQSLDVHKIVLEKLMKGNVDNAIINDYSVFVGQLEKSLSLQRIAVGKEAPDIALPGPNGKNYALSDLKGKVVLLDFWASWCGPCRRENPHVVEVYNKYKKQGFEVFSVSLDGIDARTKARFGSADQIEAQLENSKNRWKQAITQDKLTWNAHVSDLKKWDSAPAQTYGVSGIPRTFMIDREGKIAAVGLRGASMIETELKKLL